MKTTNCGARPETKAEKARVGTKRGVGSRAGLALMLCTLCAVTAYADATNWKVFAFAEDGFSVSLPSQPTLERLTRSSPAGPLEFHIYRLTLPAAALMVSVIDLPKPSKPIDAAQVLQSGIESSLTSSNSRLLHQNNIIVDGNRGIEYESESAKLHFSARTFLVGTKSYSALVVSSISSPYVETQRFLDSFRSPPAANH